MRLLCLLTVVAQASGCVIGRGTLADAEQRAARGDFRSALVEFDAIAAKSRTPAAERVRAWIAGAQACERLHDRAGVRARLEQAVASDVAGVSEPAMYYLGDLLRVEDRARALNLYYRAAAGAEKNRHGAFPYHAAMDRILELSTSR